MAVLVPGGAGFIGSHLVEALLPEHDVRVLDDLSTGSSEYVPDEAQFVEGDVRDPQTVVAAMDGVDTVYHQAAQVDVPRSIDDPLGSHATNVEGTLRVLEQARKTDTRVVIASSTAIYGRPDILPVAEDAAKQPLSPYGLEKLAADHYARLYADLYDVETVALRYFNAYGPRQGSGQYSGVIGIFTRQALAGDPVTVHGDGSQTRDFVHVEDVVEANLSAATTDSVGEAFNVGTGHSISIRELAELVIEITESDSTIRHVEPRQGDIQRSRADIRKAKRELDFEPSVSFRDGLSRYVDGVREKHD